MDDSELQQRVVLHMSRRQRFGPIACSEERDVADHLPAILGKLQKSHTTTDVPVEDSIFVVVYPPFDDVSLHTFFATNLSLRLADLSTVDVYRICVEKGERISLEKVENRLKDSYGKDRIDEKYSLTVWTAKGEQPGLYSSGSIFTAKKCVSRSLTTSTSTSDKDDRMIAPLANQPLVNPTQESLSGSGSFKGDLPNLSQREGELHGSTLSLEHKVSSVEIVENKGALKPYNEHIEEAVVQSDKPEENKASKDVLKVDALDLDGTDETVLLHAKPHNESLGTSLSQDDKQESSNGAKLSSNSDFVVPPLQKLNKNVSTGLKTTDIANHYGVVKDVEDYSHDERFLSAKQQREEEEGKEGEPKLRSEEEKKERSRHDSESKTDICLEGEKEEEGKEITKTTVVTANQVEEQRESVEFESARINPPQCHQEIGTIQEQKLCITKSQEFRHCQPHQPQSEGADCHFVAAQMMNPLAPQLLHESRVGLVYLPEPTRRNPNAPAPDDNLQNGEEEKEKEGEEGNSPTGDELKSVPDRTLIYVGEKFKKDTQLSNRDVCHHILPPPEAVQNLNPNKVLYFAAYMKYLRSTLPKMPGDFQKLPPSSFLGRGGNGFTFKLKLKEQMCAVKWTRYLPDMPEVLRVWSKFKHHNIIPFLAVARVIPGCYIIMPLMTGHLAEMVNEVDNLHILACSVDEHPWKVVIQPNVGYIFAGILEGVAFLHKNGYQHRDLKETNILYRRRCQCPKLFLCRCSFADKCDIMIADFDSLKQFSQYQLEPLALHQLNVGTINYRPRDAYISKDSPHWDMWSFGVIVCSVCHSCKEKSMIRERSKMVHPWPFVKDQQCIVICVAEVTYGRELLSSLRDKCIEKTQLVQLKKIAERCLSHSAYERVTAQQLLDTVDFLRVTPPPAPDDFGNAPFTY